jgi:hypothetical protein
METRRGNAAQTSVHTLSSGDPKTSSVEQNLDGESSWDGRESAGPDDKGDISPRPPREWSNCRRLAGIVTGVVLTGISSVRANHSIPDARNVDK